MPCSSPGRSTFSARARSRALPPPIPKRLCGHKDVATQLLHFLNQAPLAFRPPVADESIQRIIELAFYASMAPEEGRYPRFNLSCQKDSGAPFTIASFEPVPLENVDSLRRLAPVYALRVCPARD